MRYNYYSIFFIICGLLILSCDNGAKSGIEGNNNKENTIIIADNVFYHGDTINKNSNKKSSNFEITAAGVDKLRIGMALDEIHDSYKYTDYNVINYEGTRYSDDMPYLYIEDKKKQLLFVIQPDNNYKTIESIEIYSPNYHSYNGIHAGMKIKDYIKLYSKCTLHQDLSLLYTGDEYFIPIDLQKETYFHVVVGNADESIGHNFIEVEDEILTNGTRFSGYLTSDFDKSGEIKCIKIGQN